MNGRNQRRLVPPGAGAFRPDTAALGDADGTPLAITTTVGVLAAVVQCLGLIRWPFLAPYLA